MQILFGHRVTETDAGTPWTKNAPGSSIRARLTSASAGGYLPAFDPIMNVPTLWKGTSRVPIGVRTSTVPSAR